MTTQDITDAERAMLNRARAHSEDNLSPEERADLIEQDWEYEAREHRSFVQDLAEQGITLETWIAAMDAEIEAKWALPASLPTWMTRPDDRDGDALIPH